MSKNDFVTTLATAHGSHSDPSESSIAASVGVQSNELTRWMGYAALGTIPG